MVYSLTSRRLLTLFIVLAVWVIISGGIDAQTAFDLNERYIDPRDAVGINYPSGWSLTELTSGVIFFANSGSALQRILDDVPARAGDLHATLLLPRYLVSRFGVQQDESARDVTNRLISQISSSGYLPRFFTADNAPLRPGADEVAISITFDRGVGGFFGTIKRENTFVVLIGTAPSLEFDAARVIFERMFLSIAVGGDLLLDVTSTPSPTVTPFSTATATQPAFVILETPGASGVTAAPTSLTATPTPLPTETPTLTPSATFTPTPTPPPEPMEVRWLLSGAVLGFVGAAAADADGVLVADGRNGIVRVAPDGTPAGRFVVPQIDVAGDIAAAPDGTFWVADPGAKRLWQIDGVGNVLAQVGGPADFPDRFSPGRVEVSPDGETLYVFDSIGEGVVRQEVVRVWSRGGVLLRTFTVPINGLVSPRMVVGSDGRLYVADRSLGIAILEEDGTLVARDILRAAVIGYDVRGFESLSDGTFVLGIFAPTLNDARILRVNVLGDILANVTARDLESPLLTSFNTLSGFAASPDRSTLYVVDLVGGGGSRVIGLSLPRFAG